MIPRTGKRGARPTSSARTGRTAPCGICRRGLSREDDPDVGGAGRREAGRRAVTTAELTLGSTRDVIGFLAPYDRSDDDGAWYRTMVWDRHHQVPDTEPATPAEVVDVLDPRDGT